MADLLLTYGEDLAAYSLISAHLTSGEFSPAFAPRSGGWPAVEHAHLRAQPTCIACGGEEHLQVHHVKPFHLYPAKELDPRNLRTLCMHPDRRCHFLIGHGDGIHGNWSWFNPRVDDDAARSLRKTLRARSPALNLQTVLGSLVLELEWLRDTPGAGKDPTVLRLLAEKARNALEALKEREVEPGAAVGAVLLRQP